ncbi:hypothetical protein L0F63_003392 [Massospora cicadina]|nr:hypothetical protein L0F63_003392 [Massospora cicadina]
MNQYADSSGLNLPERLEDVVETDHLVIGGGVVGLATAYKLACAKRASTHLNNDPIILIERNGRVGEETRYLNAERQCGLTRRFSSHNSEVIHAGLYYALGSLKERLCIDGRRQLYEYCASKGFNLFKLGKWIVAQDDPVQMEYLHRLKERADELGVPTEFVPLPAALREEPNFGFGVQGYGDRRLGRLPPILEVAFGSFGNQHIVLNATATHVLKSPFREGYLVRVVPSKPACGDYWILARNIVNAAGLGAATLANQINAVNGTLAASFKYHYCKGSYFSYSGPAPANRLIYPVPDKHLASLGLHLTLDLSGNAKFGPDAEFLADVAYPDLDYSVNPDRLPHFLKAANAYLRGIKRGRLNPDYAGIRPKLSRTRASDFVLQDSHLRRLATPSTWSASSRQA